MEQDGASVYGRYSDSGYTSEPSRSLGHSQAPPDDGYDLQRRPRGASCRTRSSLNAVADQLTEQLVETADALVNPAGQPTRTRGTSRGVKTSIIQPVPRRSERRTTPPSLDGAAPFERESRPLPAHSSGPSRVRSVTSTITDRSEDDDASGNDDMDEAPVRLTQIVSPRTGKTRTIVRKPAAELPPTTTSVSTSVGELQFPSFMLSNQVKTFRSASHSTRRKLTATSQSAHARQQQTYSPPPEWLAAALSGNTHPHQSAPTWPATLDSFPVSRPAQLDSANGPLGSLIDDNGNSNNRHAHYDAVGSSPSFRHDTFRTMAPEPAQLLNRSPTSPLPFSLPGHMPHQHAASSPSDLTSMSRFTPPTSVTPLYEAQMLRAPPHAYAFAAEEGVFSPFSPLPSRNDQWRAQQTSGHLFLDDSFSGGDDDRHVDNDPKLSNWNDPERARLDEGQPSTSRAWHQARRSSIDYPQSDHETVPTGFARGQWPALLPQNMQNSMPLHSRETPPPNPQQMVQELARARRVAKLEEAAAEVVGPMSPLLFIRNPDHHLPPLAAPRAAAAAEEKEDRFSLLPLPSPPPRHFSPPPSASEEEDSSANGAALTYERRHFQTPEPRLPSFFSSFATQPYHNAAAAVPKSRPSSTSSYLTESGVPLTVNFRSEGEDVRARGDDSFAVHEPADENSADIEDSDADRTAVEPSAKPASPIRNDLPFTIYEDSD